MKFSRQKLQQWAEALSQRAAGSYGVAKLPGVAARKVLGGDGIFGEIPAPEGFRKQQLGFEFVIVFPAGNGVGHCVIGFDVVALDFLQNFIGAADLFVSEIENGIDEMLALQQAKAVLPAKAGEDGAVIERGLAVKVQFRSPPCSGAVFELAPEGVKVVASPLCDDGRNVFDFEAAGLLQIRRAILRVMETATKHLDVAQLLRKAQKLDAGVDRSTVYRTLQLLKRHGLIDELDLMHILGARHYYERKLNRDHIHMACLRCGKNMESVSDIFEKLKRQVEKDCRFRIVVSRLEIGGYCAVCSK